MRIGSLWAVILFVSFTAVCTHATTPSLTSMPKKPSPAVCKKWAAEQDEDAVYMWGTQEDGAHSNAVGLKRLTLACMGQQPPEIVHFGSSAGFDEAYCAAHPNIKLCGHMSVTNEEQYPGDASKDVDTQQLTQPDGTTKGGKIHGTRLWFFPPPICQQNQSDDWIQCWDDQKNPQAQFRFFVGSADSAAYRRYWTQETLLSIGPKDLDRIEPLRDFKKRANDWAKSQIADGGKIILPIHYDFLKNEQGVGAVYADWTYLNAHGVELYSQLYDIWDRGKAISLAVNFPISSKSETERNIELVGEVLRTLDLR